jgi:PAS domain S-box-containing protein
MNKIVKSDKSIVASEAKVNHAEDLVISLGEELVTAYEDKAEKANELVTVNNEKASLETALINANKKLSFQNSEKEKRAEELVIANKELAYQNSEKANRVEELIIADAEKAKRVAELIIANIEKAKRTAELIIFNKELNNQIEKREQTEQALRESNEKYSEAFKSAPYSITLTDISNGKFIEVNDAFTMIFGFTREEALTNSSIGLNIWVNPEDQKWVISTLLDGGVVSGKELLFRKENGEIITGLFASKLLNLNNDPIIISSINDITQLKQAENLLNESEQKFRSIMENSADAIFLTNQQGKYIYTNKAVTAMLGYSPEEMIKKTIVDISPPDKTEEYFEMFKQIISDGKVFTELELLKKDGNYISTDLNAVLLPDGMIYGSCRDITARKQAELDLIKAKEKAEENEEKFRSLFENSPIGKSMTGIDSSIHVNKSFCKIVGYSEEELRGKKWNEITYPEDISQTSEILQSLINGRIEQAFFEKRYIHKNGNILWTDVTTYLHRDKEHKPQFFITTISDITARKHFEEDLIAAKEKAEENDRLKSAFLSNMSHEIRTPMNGILGFTELLREPNLTIDEQQDFINTIQVSGARMLNTINNIVDVSKIESGLMNIDIKETNINEKIEFTYKFFKPEVESKGLQFLFKNGLPSTESIISTDNEKVYAVLTNLVKNAIKFTRKGIIEFGYEKKGNYLEFFVKDSGIGIDKNQQAIIFERFRQGSESNDRGYEGSGLGLSIAKSYVEMLGGKIWLESEEGKGSVFYFTIPYNPVLREYTQSENVISENAKDIELKSLKILIVEDDEISYSLLRKTLNNISSEILHAITGFEAVDICRNSTYLDLVLMDIRMPGMNGIDATRQIRQFNKEIIIIAQTAYAFAGDREKAIEAGCNDYISKPIDKTLLHELIKKHCNK